MKNLYLSIIFFLLMVGVITSQFFSDQANTKAAYIEPQLFKSDTIKSVDLGLHNAAGDLFWLGAIQYFGGNDSATYEKLTDYLNLASDLNPRFPYPYAFGALVLPGLGQTDKAIALAQKGITEASPDWRIPYYLATTYYFNKNDQEKALQYFDLAARTPGAPDNIQRIAANFATRSDKRQKSEEIWTGIYQTTNDEVVKEHAKNYILHYEIMDFLEQAIAAYKKKNDHYPTDINDLVTDNILTAIPSDPFGFQFQVNSDGTVSTK